MNEYWAIWADKEFVTFMFLYIGLIILVIYFECKYLDERKKNKQYHDFFKYINKPTTALLKPTRIAQNIKGGKPVTASDPRLITNASPIIPNMRTITAVITLLKAITRIIKRRVNRRQPKKNDTL